MSTEDVVRRYFAYLQDESVLIDADAIADLRKRAEASNDVVERLRLLSEAERLQVPDPAGLEAEFISVLPRFMRDNSITESALRSQGVPSKVLRAASKSPRRRSAPSTSNSGGRAGVGTDEVKSAIPTKGTTFTTKWLQDQSKASAGTVRKVMRELVDNGVIVERGPDPSWAGPGRVPTLYEQA